MTRHNIIWVTAPAELSRDIAEALAGLKLECQCVPNGEAALSLIDSDTVAILAPLEMNDLSPAEFVRRSVQCRKCPVLFMGGNPAPEFSTSEEALIDTLPAPADPVALQRRLSLYVKLHTQEQMLARQASRLEAEEKDRKRAEMELQESEVRYRTLLELSPVAIIVQVEDRIVYVNAAALHLLRLEEREEMLDRNISDFFHPDARESGRAYVEDLVRKGGQLAPIEGRFNCGDGSSVHIEIAGACIMYIGEVGVQLAILDVTQRKLLEEELRSLSRNDGLTNIPNRLAFNEAIDRECRRARRNSLPIAVILVDVDFFKTYNDNYGHQAGDEALIHVAARLSSLVKRGPDLVARYGGEEFIVVLPETTLEGAKVVAEALQKGVYDLHIAHTHSPVSDRVTVSMGVVYALPDANVTVEGLVEAADKALYQAKSGGRNKLVYTQF